MQMARFRCRITNLTGRTSFIHFPALSPCLAALIAVFLFVMGIGIGKTWAGPPFVTDDPEPVDYKHGGRVLHRHTICEGQGRDLRHSSAF